MSGGVTNAAGVTEIGSLFPNTFNGQTITLTPQNTSALNVNADNWYIDAAAASFLGNIYQDAVICFGYNVAAHGGIAGSQTGILGPDPFSAGEYFESDYQFNIGNANDHGTATGGSTTTLQDTGKAWNVNQWANWVLFNVTTNGRALILSNTATQLTTNTMVLADGATAAAANANGNTYQIYTRQMELYWEICNLTTSGQFRRTRPIEFYFDKGTAAAQGALAANGLQTISAATASAAPTTFTSSGNHGLPAGTLCYVKFWNMTGGTWSNLNGHQYLATVTGATTFTCGVVTTGFGTFTSGSFALESYMSQVNHCSITIEPFGGMAFFLPAWTGGVDTVTAFDTCYLFKDSVFNQYGRQGSNGNLVQYVQIPDVGGNTSMASTNSLGQTIYDIRSQDQSTMFDVFTSSNGATGTLGVSYSIYRPGTGGAVAASDTSHTFGYANPGYVQGLMNLSATGMTASRSMLNFKPAASQTGDYIDCWDATGNTTKLFSVNSSGAIGVNSTAPPAQQTGWGTPTGTGVIANFPGATATLAQTSQAAATLIAYMKSIGFFGA